MDRLLRGGLSAASPQFRAVVALLDPHCDVPGCLKLLQTPGDLFLASRQQNVAGVVGHRWMPQFAEVLPPEEVERWRTLLFSAAAVQIRQTAEAVSLLNGLATAGVCPVVMRGLWLSHAVYPDPSLRPHNDIDLLLPLDGLNDGLGAMVGLGYTLKGPTLPIDTGSLLRHMRAGYGSGFSAVLRPSGPDRFLSIDVHASLHIVGLGWWPYGPTPEELFERTAPWSLEGAPALQLQLPMALLGLVENMARHAAARDGYGNWLVRLYDMLLLARRMDDGQWEQLVRDARQFRLAVQSAMFLGLVEELWGAHWPAGTLADLRRPTVAYRAARLAASRPRWLGHVGRVALLQAAATLTWPGAVAYVSRNALWAVSDRLRAKPPSVSSQGAAE